MAQELNENEIKFIEEIATQLTELYYGDDTWSEEVEQHSYHRVFSEEAALYFEGKYDEWKTYYINIRESR